MEKQDINFSFLFFFFGEWTTTLNHPFSCSVKQKKRSCYASSKEINDWFKYICWFKVIYIIQRNPIDAKKNLLPTTDINNPVDNCLGSMSKLKIQGLPVHGIDPIPGSISSPLAKMSNYKILQPIPTAYSHNNAPTESHKQVSLVWASAIKVQTVDKCVSIKDHILSSTGCRKICNH